MYGWAILLHTSQLTLFWKFNFVYITALIRRFDLISHFLLHGSAKGLNYRIKSPFCCEDGPIYTLKKISKVFWAFSLPLEGFCPPFSNSPSHASYPHIFSQLSNSMLTSFFTVFNLLMIIQTPHDNHSQTGVTNLWAVNHTLPPHLPTSPVHLLGSGGFLPPTSPLHHYRHPYTITGRRRPYTTGRMGP